MKTILFLFLLVTIACTGGDVPRPERALLPACGVPDSSTLVDATVQADARADSGHDAAVDARADGAFDSGPDAVADAAPEAGEEPPAGITSAAVVYVGHSLIGHRVPAMVQGLAADAGLDYAHAKQMFNGAALASNWRDAALASAPNTNFKTALAIGAYDHLIITERVSIVTEANYWGADCWAASMRGLLEQGSPGGKLWVYESWEDATNPTGGWPVPSPLMARWPEWRQSITNDRARWQQIATRSRLANSWVTCLPNQWTNCRPANSTNENCTTAEHPLWSEAKLIPVAGALGALYDALQAGPVGTITSIADVFVPENYGTIHLNDRGWYLAACTVFAAVYERSPVGLTHDLAAALVPVGGGYAGPDAATAAALQAIAWSVVQ